MPIFKSHKQLQEEIARDIAFNNATKATNLTVICANCDKVIRGGQYWIKSNWWCADCYLYKYHDSTQ